VALAAAALTTGVGPAPAARADEVTVRDVAISTAS